MSQYGDIPYHLKNTELYSLLGAAREIQLYVNLITSKNNKHGAWIVFADKNSA